ncbi:MAG: dihydroneopterin aldolase [Bacteroidetes bacterium]|nr:MAG: dihydroneopterin aldolase [Bacteroidota bacterium]
MLNNFTQISISLEKMSFFGFHGVYESEQKEGNSFEVCIELDVIVPLSVFDDNLSHTVDYVLVYKIAETVMKKPQKLLETLCFSICQKIKSEFILVKKATVSVSKLNPPLDGKCERTTVKISM